MTNAQTFSMSQLPLSWARTTIAEPLFDQVKLPFTAPKWIPTAEIPHDITFDELYREHLSQLPQGFVLQSCNLALRDYLITQGCQSAPMGAEAILDLPWRGKKSVRELARRGRRHGTIREVGLNRLHQFKLTQLVKESPSRQGVQLRHTERVAFDESTRCVVFETPEGKWLGAVTLSTVNPTYVHTELLLRHPDAPTGIMEALITAIAQKLTEEGVQHFSLGNVTPIPTEEFDELLSPHRVSNDLWHLSCLAFWMGRKLNFAFNADGLWRFKNKFSPRWEPLYLCASPKLSLATVTGLFYMMGYVELVWNQVLETWSITQSIQDGRNFMLSLRRNIALSVSVDGAGLIGDVLRHALPGIFMSIHLETSSFKTAFSLQERWRDDRTCKNYARYKP